MPSPLKLLQMLRGAKDAAPAARTADMLPVLAPAPTPGLQQVLNNTLQAPVTRRDVLKRAGAQAAGAAMDVSPVGALAKLAADPVKSAALKAAAQEVAPAVRTLTDFDHAARNAMMWSLTEAEDVNAMVGVWAKLRPQLELGLDPALTRRMDELAERVREGYPRGTSSDQMFDEADEFAEALADVLDKANVPPEVVHSALPRNMQLRAADADSWMNAVAAEGMDDVPSQEQMDALHRAMFGKAPKPLDAPTFARRDIELRKLTPVERNINNELWGAMYVDANAARSTKGMLSAWASLKDRLQLSPQQAQSLNALADQMASAQPGTREGVLAKMEFNRQLEPFIVERVPPQYIFDVVRDYGRLRSKTPEERMEALRRMTFEEGRTQGDLDAVYRNMFGDAQ